MALIYASAIEPRPFSTRSALLGKEFESFITSVKAVLSKVLKVILVTFNCCGIKSAYTYGANNLKSFILKFFTASVDSTLKFPVLV